MAASVTAAVRADQSSKGVNAGIASFMECRVQGSVSIDQVCRQRMVCCAEDVSAIALDAIRHNALNH